MGKNAYFQIVHKTNKTMLKVFPASKDGAMFSIDEVITYMELINFGDFDVMGLNSYLTKGDFRNEFLLLNQEVLPEDGRCAVSIQKDRKSVV